MPKQTPYPRKPRMQWTAEHTRILRAMYPDHSTREVAERIGAPIRHVYYKAHTLGLKKSPEFMASQQSGRIQPGEQHAALKAGRFAPGNTPWNKGKSFQAGGRSVESQFRPGRPPQEAHNYVPIGSLRFTKDGHWQRKTSDDQRLLTVRRWTPVTHLVWEAAHGPIPWGHIVRFRDGAYTAELEKITVDRLECITKRENMRRNSMWQQDPEIARLQQLKGCITRQVNRIAKTQTQGQNP